jgi:hypothetical protein
MDEHHVGIPPATNVERLTCTDCDHLDGNASGFGEDWQEMPEQARLLRGCRRRYGDGTLLGMSKDRGSEKTRNNPTYQMSANGIHSGVSSHEGHQATCMLPRIMRDQYAAFCMVELRASSKRGEGCPAKALT